MRVTVTIDCDNAAFEDDLREEVARILTKVPDVMLDLLEYPTTFTDLGEPLRDLNGNVVGRVAVER